MSPRPASRSGGHVDVAAAAASAVEAYLADTSSSPDPYPAYRALRAVAPIHWSETNGYWIVTGHPEAEELLRHPSMSREKAGIRQFGWIVGDDDPPETRAAVDAWLSTILNTDPPEHTRVRGLLSRAFTPRAVRPWVQRTEVIVDELFAGLEGRDAFDVLGAIGYPVAEQVICELMGVPLSDHDRWKQWSSGLNQGAIFAGAWKPGDPYPPDALATAQDSVRNWAEYFAELVDQRRGGGGTDLISVLARLEEEGDRLSEPELVGTLSLLIGAGHETTANLIANGVLALLDHPDQYRRLREDPSLATSMVEEVLRYDGSARGQPRVALDDVWIGGHTIGEGDLVMVVVNAANRDPRRFPEPERFDIGRTDTGHLAFSTGIHFCLGAALARMEVATVFRRIAEAPWLLESTGEPRSYRRTHGRNLVSLPVRKVSV